VVALDALRGQFDNFAVLVVRHEGHTKGRGRRWSRLRAAVDAEFRAERGKDDLLRLECTKSKDTRPVDPMAFQFAGVDLGITDEDGNPLTSAVLNPVGCTPAPEAAGNKPAGKNQALALDILKRLETEAWNNRGMADGLLCLSKTVYRMRIQRTWHLAGVTAKIRKIIRKGRNRPPNLGGSRN
jgi:hypothetical protein